MFNLLDLFRNKQDVEPALVIQPVEVVEVVEEVVKEPVPVPAQPVLTLGKWCEMSGLVLFTFKKTSKASREECPRCGRDIHCGKSGRFMPHHEVKPIPKN